MDNFDFETSDIVAEATKKYSPEKGKISRSIWFESKKDNQIDNQVDKSWSLWLKWISPHKV